MTAALDTRAEEDTRPRWFAVEPGLAGPVGMIWIGQPNPRPKERGPYLFGPLELSRRGRALTLDQLMASWRTHGTVPRIVRPEIKRDPPRTRVLTIAEMRKKGIGE